MSDDEINLINVIRTCDNPDETLNAVINALTSFVARLECRSQSPLPSPFDLQERA